MCTCARADVGTSSRTYVKQCPKIAILVGCRSRKFVTKKDTDSEHIKVVLHWVSFPTRIDQFWGTDVKRTYLSDRSLTTHQISA